MSALRHASLLRAEGAILLTAATTLYWKMAPGSSSPWPSSCPTYGSLLIAAALIWLAHIGFDRMVGYGLKYAEGFKETHLARI